MIELTAEDREKIRSSLQELAETIRRQTNCSVAEATQRLRDLCP
jgi:hypothetical protein